MRREIAEIVVQHSISGKFRIVTNENRIIYKRLFYSSNYSICEYMKGKTSLGTQVSDSEIDTWKTIELVKVSDLELVKKFLTKVVKYLEVSGLWNNIKVDYANLLAKGDAFLEELIKSDYTKQREILRDNNLSFHCDSIIRTAKKGVVSINYNKYNKDKIRDIFKSKIENKEEFDFSWRKGYDNNIACKKVNDIMCAWYSTEYKGLGNGHYYLAIDECHAFYCETD